MFGRFCCYFPFGNAIFTVPYFTTSTEGVFAPNFQWKCIIFACYFWKLLIRSLLLQPKLFLHLISSGNVNIAADRTGPGCLGLQARFVGRGFWHDGPRIAARRKIDLYRTHDQVPLHPGPNFLETRVGMNCIEPHDHHLFFCKLF